MDRAETLINWLEIAGGYDRVRIATGFVDEDGLKKMFEHIPRGTPIRLLAGEVLQKKGDSIGDYLKEGVNNLKSETIAEELYQRLQEDLSIRVVDGLHAKIYLSDGGGVAGSSNLTRGGLVSNTEYNFILTESQYHRASEWFDRNWEEGIELTDKFIHNIEESSYGPRVVEVPIEEPDRLYRTANLPSVGLEEEFTNLSLPSQIALLDEEITPDYEKGNATLDTFSKSEDTVEYLAMLLAEASKRRGGADGFEEFILDFVDERNVKRSKYIWKNLYKSGECEDIQVRPEGLAWILEWWLENGDRSPDLPEEIKYDERRPILTMDLWDHQKQAVREWVKHGGKGIIEMATGTGKTMVGLAAIERVCDTNSKVEILVVAHRRNLVNQWRSEMRKRFHRINYSVFDYEIEVKTADEVTSNLKKHKETHYDLIIVDEVHHYTNIGGQSWGEVAKLNCDRVLGLSAEVSVEIREDLESLVGQVVFEYPQKEAISEGIVPEFRWLLHEVSLTPDEKQRYRKRRGHIKSLLEEIKRKEYTQKVASELGVSLVNFDLGDFLELREGSNRPESEAPDEWEDLLNQIWKLREIVYTSQHAKEETIELAREYAQRGLDVIVFTMRKEDAEEITQRINSARVVHSGIDNKYEVLDEFENSEDDKVLVGVKMLDEGVDIPEVDVGINTAAEKSRRQLIQRQGRILRRNGDHKPIFHHFVIEKESNYYSNLGSVDPEFTKPKAVVEPSLPTTIGTVDLWDIYKSLGSTELHQIKESDDFVTDGLTGSEWWLQMYQDFCPEIFHDRLREDSVH